MIEQELGSAVYLCLENYYNKCYSTCAYESKNLYSSAVSHSNISNKLNYFTEEFISIA
jgi:hypothetical protein